MRGSRPTGGPASPLGPYASRGVLAEELRPAGSHRRPEAEAWIRTLLVAWVALPVVAVAGPTDATAQAPAIADIGLSADSVEIGDRFDLRFTLHVDAGDVVLFPDSLEGPGLAPFGPVEWESTGEAAVGRTLSVAYPLIAFRTGSLAVPEVHVFVAPASEAIGGDLSRPGDVVGSWEAFREAPAATTSAVMITVPELRVQVSTVLALDDVTTRIAPRPAADVWGGDRHWPSMLLFALSGLLLAGLAVVSAREWVAGRGADTGAPLSERGRALAALDELMAQGLHEGGRVRTFYAGWSEIVRRYVEGFDDVWGPSWTSTELFSDLQGPRRDRAVRRSLSPEGIAAEIRIAEEVKFGGVRPDPDTAEEHWRAVRTWIEGAQETAP